MESGTFSSQIEERRSVPLADGRNQACVDIGYKSNLLLLLLSAATWPQSKAK